MAKKTKYRHTYAVYWYSVYENKTQTATIEADYVEVDEGILLFGSFDTKTEEGPHFVAMFKEWIAWKEIE